MDICSYDKDWTCEIGANMQCKHCGRFTCDSCAEVMNYACECFELNDGYKNLELQIAILEQQCETLEYELSVAENNEQVWEHECNEICRQTGVRFKRSNELMQ